MMRLGVAALSLLVLSLASRLLAQESPAEGAPQRPPVVIISVPPGPAQEPVAVVPPLKPGEVILHGAPVRVRFQSPTAGVSFMMWTGGVYSETKGWWLDLGLGFGKEGVTLDPGFGVHSSETETKEYILICHPPCEGSLPSGTHRIALSLEGGKPVEPKHPTVLSTDSIVDGRYINRRGMRIAGWVIFTVGMLTGTMMMLLSTGDTTEPYTLDITNKPAFYTGVGLTAASLAVGIAFAAQKDKAIINVYPMR